jgi:hypothetical protein
MNINKTVASGAAIAAVAAGAFLLASAPATQAAPPSKTPSAPILVDATGAAVSGVVDIPGGTSVIRIVDGGMWRFNTLGEFQGDTQAATVAYLDATCTVPVLVNGDLGDDASAPLYHAPVAMSAVKRVDRTITHAYVVDGGSQSGTVFTTNWLDGTCQGPALDQQGNTAKVNYYPAMEIPIPANLPGPLNFK